MKLRLTPQPAILLGWMNEGARLRERVWRSTEWHFFYPKPGPDVKSDDKPPPDPTIANRKTGRQVNQLIRHKLIERIGELPSGRLPHWHEFEWQITDRGKEVAAAGLIFKRGGDPDFLKAHRPRGVKPFSATHMPWWSKWNFRMREREQEDPVVGRHNYENYYGIGISCDICGLAVSAIEHRRDLLPATRAKRSPA